MKTKFFTAAVLAAAIVWASSSSSLFAQGAGGGPVSQFGQGPAATMPGNPSNGVRPSGPAAIAPAAGSQLGLNGLAVVDVAYIFKNHQRFKQQMDGMKQKAEAAKADLQHDQDEIKKKMEQLKTFAPGSPEYKKMEADILKAQGDLNLKNSLTGKNFAEEEGRIFFNVSREIDDAVKLISTRNGILLAMRFNGDPVDPNDRNDILRGVNKALVYFDPRMDITPYVLQELNRSAAGTGNIGVRPQPTGGVQPR